MLYFYYELIYDRYTGTLDVLRRTLAAEGARGLYRGIGPNMLKVLPATGISYTIYDLLKRRAQEE